MALIGGAGEMDATKQERILSVVQRELKFSAMLPSVITDVSQFAVKGYNQVSFPKLASFTAELRAAGAAFSEQVIASSKDTMLLDKCAGVHYIIDPCEEIESTLQWELESAKRAATALARKVDEDIIAEMETAGVEVGTAGDITRDIILDMREELLNREARLEDNGFILVSVDQEKALLKIDEFKNQDIYGENGVVRSGQIGSIYGMPVLRHSALGAQTYYMASSEAMAIGFQKLPKFGEVPAPKYGADAKETVVDQKYGVKALQVGEAGVGAAESALIMKDAN